MDAPRTDWSRMNRDRDFAVLSVCLDGHSPVPTYAELADQLGMTGGSVKVAVHRLRERFRELLRAAVAETVHDPADVDAELRHLVTALRA